VYLRQSFDKTGQELAVDQIDAGEVPLGGDEGLLKGMLKAALERGLEVELTDHVGYERGDPDASLFPNS
jgi:putative transposase